MNRRAFLIISAACVIPQNVVAYTQRITIFTPPLQTLALLHRDLFKESKIANILHNINAIAYFAGVLEDPYISEDEKRFLRDGFTWLNESANATYIQLPTHKRQKVLTTFSQTRRGENWLYAILGYFFEAMLCDPVYGANIDKAGWEYLGHKSGYPRPKGVLGAV